MKDIRVKYMQTAMSDKIAPYRWKRRSNRDLELLTKIVVSDDLVRYNMISDQHHEDVQFDIDVEEYLKRQCGL